jgi:hypothetical protein
MHRRITWLLGVGLGVTQHDSAEQNDEAFADDRHVPFEVLHLDPPLAIGLYGPITSRRRRTAYRSPDHPATSDPLVRPIDAVSFDLSHCVACPQLHSLPARALRFAVTRERASRVPWVSP